MIHPSGSGSGGGWARSMDIIENSSLDEDGTSLEEDSVSIVFSSLCLRRLFGIL